MIHHLLSTLERLEGLLDEAIAGMTAKQRIDDAALASAKGRALLALTRLSAEFAPGALPEDVRARIRRVREKLGREHTMLERRLEASQLVVGLIAEAVMARDWDGTYGPALAQRHAGTVVRGRP
ncbi:MAG: hypothetical protein AcusKO_19620 [Acuticoccus sp.]